jgi:NADH:ubiquinone oxidoreductase subunit B-like Fe-S oxidoreductase
MFVIYQRLARGAGLCYEQVNCFAVAEQQVQIYGVHYCVKWSRTVAVIFCFDGVVCCICEFLALQYSHLEIFEFMYHLSFTAISHG